MSLSLILEGKFRNSFELLVMLVVTYGMCFHILAMTSQCHKRYKKDQIITELCFRNVGMDLRILNPLKSIEDISS